MIIASDHAVWQLQPSAGHEPREILSGDQVRFVTCDGPLMAIALAGGRLRLGTDGEWTEVATGIEEKIHSMLILETAPPEVLVGTEPPHVYRVRPGADEPVVREPMFDKLEVRDQWDTPWGGPPAVRSFAAAPEGYVYADIHVGSIMRSPDRGKAWATVEPTLNRDVHQVATTPAAPKRVYAQTARGFYLSEHRGEGWEHRADDLDERYGRCVTVHPEDPDLVLSTVSDGPHGDDVRGQLYRSTDAGVSWAHVTDGFPGATKKNIDTYRVDFDAGGTAWAAVEETLYVGRDRAAQWETAWEAPEPLRTIVCNREIS